MRRCAPTRPAARCPGLGRGCGRGTCGARRGRRAACTRSWSCPSGPTCRRTPPPRWAEAARAPPSRASAWSASWSAPPGRWHCFGGRRRGPPRATPSRGAPSCRWRDRAARRVDRTVSAPPTCHGCVGRAAPRRRRRRRRRRDRGSCAASAARNASSCAGASSSSSSSPRTPHLCHAKTPTFVTPAAPWREARPDAEAWRDRDKRRRRARPVPPRRASHRLHAKTPTFVTPAAPWLGRRGPMQSPESARASAPTVVGTVARHVGGVIE